MAKMKLCSLTIFPINDFALRPENLRSEEGVYDQVLVYVPEFGWQMGFYIESLDEWRIEGSPSSWKPTHWCHLPGHPS